MNTSRFTKRKTIAVRPRTHKRIVRYAARKGLNVEIVADAAANMGMDEMERKRNDQ